MPARPSRPNCPPSRPLPGRAPYRRSSSGGNQMELVPNAFTAGRCGREVDTFIRKFASIPAFTANLTMDFFQKQTQC